METRRPAFLRPLAALPHFSVRDVEDEMPGASLCGLHAHVLIEPIDRASTDTGEPCELRMTIDPDELDAVDVTTLRLFAIALEDPAQPRFSLVDRSGFDPATGELWARIERTGRYGAYALPADPRGRFAVEQLLASYPIIRREMIDGGTTFRDRICEYVLCTGDQRGGGPCARCLGLELTWAGPPEFALFEPRPIPGPVDLQASCLLIDGPIAYRDEPGNLVTISSPGSSPATVVAATADTLITSFEIGPDGITIAFITEGTTGSPMWTVETCSVDGTNRSPVLTSTDELRSITWRPTAAGARRLGFTVRRPTGVDLDVIDVDGAGRDTLISSPIPQGAMRLIDVDHPRWSPDGKHVAFVANVDDPARGAHSVVATLLCVASGDGAGVTRAPLQPALIAQGPVFWLPDGSGIGCGLTFAYVGSPSVYPFVAGALAGPFCGLALAAGGFADGIAWLSVAPRGDRVVTSRVGPGLLPRDLWVHDLHVNWSATPPITMGPPLAINRQGYHPNWGATCAT